MSKAQVKAVRRRLLASGHRQNLDALHAVSKIPMRVLLDNLTLLRGDFSKLRTLAHRWQYPDAIGGVPLNLSFSAFVRYSLRREQQVARKTTKPYGRQ